MPDLRGNELVWLADYLDKVCCHVAFFAPRFNCFRLSMSSISPVLLSESVSANSEEYAELGGYSRRHTCFLLIA